MLAPTPNQTGRSSYSLAQKTFIVEEAYLMVNQLRLTARKYGLSPNMIRRWNKIFQRNRTNPILLSVTRKRLPGAGRKPLIPKALEEHLVNFVKERRSRDLKVSVRMLIIEWKRKDPVSVGHIKSESLRLRVNRIIKRNNIGWRRTTHQAQNTRHSQAVCDDFVSYIKEKMRMLDIDASNVVNFDETNVHFSIATKKTLNVRGARTVSVRDAESSQRCTVMLGVTGDGQKVPPFIIFKGSNKVTGRINRELQMITEEHTFGFPTQMKYAVQNKAWMDEFTMLDWVEKVWKPFADSKEGMTYMILDEAASHMTRNVREAIAQCNTEIDFIPGGYTSKLQVLDVGINKPFKDRVREHYENYMVMTVDGKPKRQDVAHWIWDSWDDITDTMITNTWRHIGITGGVAGGVANDEVQADDGMDTIDDPLEMLDVEEDEQSDDENAEASL
jgi:hypothetical protein